MRTNRLILQLAVCCALGASTTVAIAAYAAWHSRGGNRFAGVRFSDYACTKRIPAVPVSGIHEIGVLRRRFFGFVDCSMVYERGFNPQPSTADPIDETNLRRATAPFIQALAAPGALDGQVLTAFKSVTTGGGIVAVKSLAAGWPLLCFEGRVELRLTSPPTSHLVNVRFIHPRWTPFASDWPMPRWSLPFRPMPWRLCANIAIFAVAWWLLLLGPKTIRLALRRRRGLCPHCAYDLRATPSYSPCPECGRTPRPTVSTSR